jgi:A nuclease of the HNH/ENDO VII superfamily with conserved WHH/RTX calcium-binding nonapeptide repeat (4 copies)
VLIGTPGDDVLTGTAGPDFICGLDGNDVIVGLGGNDTLIGGAGNDRLDGGLGDDRILGGTGDDILLGELGNDVVLSGSGSDVVNAGGGDDRLYGEDGIDDLHGDDGNDAIYGGQGDDQLFGGPGDDDLSGGPGEDNVNGSQGWDRCATTESGPCDQSEDRATTTPTVNLKPVFDTRINMEIRNGSTNPDKIVFAELPSPGESTVGPTLDVSSTSDDVSFDGITLTLPVFGDPTTAEIVYLDEVSNVWMPYPDPVYDRSNHFVTASIDHFTTISVQTTAPMISVGNVGSNVVVVEAPLGGRTCIAKRFQPDTELVIVQDVSGSDGRSIDLTSFPETVRVTVIETGDQARTVITPSSDRSEFFKRYTAANFGPSRLDRGIEAATLLLENSAKPFRQLLIVSDLEVDTIALPALPALADRLNRADVAVSIQHDSYRLNAPSAAVFYTKLKSVNFNRTSNLFDGGSSKGDTLSDCEKEEGVLAWDFHSKTPKSFVLNVRKRDFDSDGLDDQLELPSAQRLRGVSRNLANMKTRNWGRNGRYVVADPTRDNTDGRFGNDFVDFVGGSDPAVDVTNEISFLTPGTKTPHRTFMYTVGLNDAGTGPNVYKADLNWDTAAQRLGFPVGLEPSFSEGDWFAVAIQQFFLSQDAKTTFDTAGNLTAEATAYLKQLAATPLAFGKLPKYGRSLLWLSLDKEGKRLLYSKNQNQILDELVKAYEDSYQKEINALLLRGLLITVSIVTGFFTAVYVGSLAALGTFGLAVAVGGSVGGVLASASGVVGYIAGGAAFGAFVACELKCSAEDKLLRDALLFELQTGVANESFSFKYSPNEPAIDWARIDENGLTNAERRIAELPPLSNEGVPVEGVTKALNGQPAKTWFRATKTRYRNWVLKVKAPEPVSPQFGPSVETETPEIFARYGAETPSSKLELVGEKGNKNWAAKKDQYARVFMDSRGDIEFGDNIRATERLAGFDPKPGASQNDINLANAQSAAKGGPTMESLYLETEKRWTWHHLRDCHTMVLITKELHEAWYPHAGGRFMIEKGLC